MRQEPGPGLGQLDMVAAADEQRLPQFVLQALDSFRQGLLAQVKPRGRPPEVQVLRGDDERADLPQVKVHGRHQGRQRPVVDAYQRLLDAAGPMLMSWMPQSREAPRTRRIAVPDPPR